ncbi:MAG: ion channel [Burkholderiales bacterium]
MTRFSNLLKTLYSHFTRLAWDALFLLIAIHVLVSYAGMRLFETGEIIERVAFWYYYMTTVTTIGYGDIAPKTPGGRLFTTLWIMPGGIMLFTASIAKFIQFIADRWRKRMRGEADYSYLENHIVILGWQGLRTQRMVDEIIADVGATRREIVLCTTKDIENPMPDKVKFVRDKALSEAGLHRRAGSAGADVILALGHDDNDTLAAALAASSVNKHAHVVAHFEQQSFADLLVAHCPRAETMVSLSTEMMVRAALDPGSSRVHRDLLSVVGGQNNFSMRVPADAPVLRYGQLLQALKQHHNATLIAVANDTEGSGLRPNAAGDSEVKAGAVLYYIAARRLDPAQVDWRAAA